MANNIIITGANQGIGYYMVEKLLAEGNKVSVLDIETDNLTNLKKKYDCLIFYKVDLRNYDEVKRAVDETVAEFDTIDIAVHNACKCTFESERKTDLDTYMDVFDVNYFGALRLVKCVIPYMSAQKKGRVIFTSSGVGVTGFMNISPYSSTKGALEALAKCLRIEYLIIFLSCCLILHFILCIHLLQEQNLHHHFLFPKSSRHYLKKLVTDLQSI